MIIYKLTVNYTQKTKNPLFSKIPSLTSITLLCWYHNRTNCKYYCEYLDVLTDSRLNLDLQIAHVGKKFIYGNAALYKLQPYVIADVLRKVYFSIVYAHYYHAILFEALQIEPCGNAYCQIK